MGGDGDPFEWQLLVELLVSVGSKEYPIPIFQSLYAIAFPFQVKI